MISSKQLPASLVFFSVAIAMLMCSPSAEAGEKPSATIRLSGRHTAGADIADSDASMAVTSARIDARWKFLSLSYTQSSYAWDNAEKLGFSNGSDTPWETLHHIALGANFRGDISDRWFYHTGASVTSSFEKEMGGSYGGVVRGGVGYLFTENIRVTAGVAVSTNTLRTRVAPLVALSYDGLEHDGSGWTGRIGFPVSVISYHFDGTIATRLTLTNRLTLDPNGETARLSDSSDVEEKGYVSVSGRQAGLYLDWNPSHAITLSVGPEYSFGRSLAVYGEDGDKVYDEEVGSGVGGALRLRYFF